MIRATTGGVLKSYRRNLMGSFTGVNKARDTVLSQRVFNSYAEDPATAAKAFKLRKSRMAVNSQHKICADTYRKYQTAWSCLETVDKVLDTDSSQFMKTLKGTTLTALNDPTGDAREQLTTALDQMSETIVQTMNQRYGENFIFAGADGHNVPFEVRNIGGEKKLFYRGVDVDAAVPETLQDENDKNIMLDENGNVDTNGKNYLSPDAELVEVPKAAQNGGADIMLNEDGDYDPAGTTMLLEGYMTIKKTHYDALVAADPTAPETTVLMDAGSGNPYSVTDKDGDEAYIMVLGGGFKTMTADEVKELKDSAIVDNATGDPYVYEQDGKEYYIVKNEDNVITEEEYNKACSDAEKLKYLANEKYFVDIGLGFQENEKGNLIESSGYNASLVGLNFIGYGKDEDGDPKNLYSIVQKLKEICGRVKDGKNWTESDYDEFYGLVQKLERGSSEFKTEFTNMDAGTTKLKNNLALLEDNFYTLQEQYSDLEDVDMADAITSFVWAQYCYNAALKVGNSILSESLMDYLR